MTLGEQSLIADRYRLISRIGAGAMGVVWQAHDERLHRTVAVKQLLSQPGLSAEQADEARQRAMREGRIAARLAHPNAITVYDAAEHDGEPWLIMEYLPSKSLATVLGERGTLPPAEAARIGAQVAAALVAAHAAGIVHRDVKPANVLLAEDGTVKITDFGISRATGDVTVTATGMLAGTPAYLAPEVAKGEQPTAAADVFSLGSTLYTAVEGHSPFGLSENTLALLYAVAAGKVTPPRQAGPLTALLMQLLRADPTERPTMTAAREALGAVAVGKPLPSVLLANQRTDPYPMPPVPPTAANTTVLPSSPAYGTPRPPVGPPPIGQRSPAHGTRLDMHPFAEPNPSGPNPAPPRQQQPPQQRPRTPAAAPPKQGKRDARSVVLTVLAIVGAALVGILVASLLTGDRQEPRADASPTTQVPTPTVAPTTVVPTTTPTTTQPTTTTTVPPTTTEQQPQGPTAADYVNTVRAYYSLLPADPQAGWKMLTEQARHKSGGFDRYKNFWGGVTKVEVLSAEADGERVRAELRYTSDKGDTQTERMDLTVVQRDGQLMIDDFRRKGGRDRDDDEGN